MKKFYLFLFALLPALMAFGQYKPGYYDKMDGKIKAELKAAAKECVSAHSRLVYTDLPYAWQYTDVYPDLVDGQKRWWEMYSGNIYLIRRGQDARSSFSANKMQREHVIPKSWWKKDGDVEYTPAYTDIWNLYPSDGPANQAKLNYPFGETDAPTYNNGVSEVGPAKTGQGGGSGKVFEPGNEYKGDFARTIFYMATVYDDLDWVYPYMFRTQEWPTLQPWSYQLLLQWARTDPVSQKEIDRNNAVEQQQGNRNPFIDFPELAEYIWGTRTTETFYIKDQGGTVTPPITGDPELVRPATGTALDFGEVALGNVKERPLEIVARNLTSPLSVRIIGTNRTMFRVDVKSIPAADLNTAEVYKLSVFYQPSALGEHTATLSLYDGGLGMDQDVAVELRGQALPVPSLSRITATSATEIGPSSYVANWNPSPEVVDYYVLNRVRYTEAGAVASTYEADTNSLLIEDRDENVAESYTVQASRLGYLSEASNAITVASGAILGVEADQPLTLGYVPGGFIVLSDNPQADLRVYDTAGTLVLSRSSVEGGEQILLPAGVYIVTSNGTSRPIKTLVR